VLTQHNGRSICKPIETAYLHADSSDYGRGAVLNDDSKYQARGFWSATDRLQHITWKELRAVRHAVESFLPQLKGRQVLLHEDNTAVVAALTNQTHLAVACHDDRAPALVILSRHQRHPHPPALHPVGRQRLGGHAKPRIGHRGLAAQPPAFQTPTSTVGPAYDRPFRVYAKRPTPAVQRPLEGPAVRGRRLPTTARRSLASRKQLLQPSLDRLTGACRQAGPITCHGDCHRPLRAGQNAVPRFRPALHRNFALPGGPRPFHSRQARQARGGRTSRVEHRGLSALTPSWLYTRRGAIGHALRPD
jgi:hypothetical protein